MKYAQSRSKTPPKRIVKQFQTFELNNAIYQGDTLHFQRDGFGTILTDDGSYFTGIFCRDQLKGPGALFFQNSMLYSDFTKGQLQGPTILKQEEFIWCGVLKDSKPTQISYLYNLTTQIWSIVHKPEMAVHLSWPNLPNFIDLKLQGLLKRVLSFDFQFLSSNSLAYDSYGILWPPPQVKLIYETKQKDSSGDLLRPVLDKGQQNNLVYLGYLTVNNSMDQYQEDLVPHGIGFFVDHVTMRVHLSGLFEKSWLEGLGRQLLENGDIIEGNFRKSTLNGVGLRYTSVSDSYVLGVFEKNYLIGIHQYLIKKESKFEGSGYPRNLVSQMANKIHQSSIQYKNQNISWKKLLGVDHLDLFKVLTEVKFQKQSNRENNVQNSQTEYKLFNNYKIKADIESSFTIVKNLSVQRLSKNNLSLSQKISERQLYQHLPPINKFKHPVNFEKYYFANFLEEMVVRSVNNRMNDYSEFRYIIAQSTNKFSNHDLKYTYFNSASDYQGIISLQEQMNDLTIRYQVNHHTDLNSLAISLNRTKQFNEAQIVSSQFKENFLNSPKFNQQSIKSVMDSQLKDFNVTQQSPQSDQQSQQLTNYNFAWQRDITHSTNGINRSSHRQKKRIFDQTLSTSVKRLNLSSSSIGRKLFE